MGVSYVRCKGDLRHVPVNVRARPTCARCTLLASASRLGFSPRLLASAWSNPLFLIGLAFLTLSLFTTSPAQAQYNGGYPGSGGVGGYPGSGNPGSGSWQFRSCDAGGNLIVNPLRDANGLFRLIGTVTGSTTNTYPASGIQFFTPSKAETNAIGSYSFLFDPSQMPVAAGDFFHGPGVICLPAYGGSYAWNGQDSQGNLINGSVTTDITGKVAACFGWFYLDGNNIQVKPPVGSFPPGISDHQDFLLQTSVSASTAHNYGTSGVTDGLSAYAKAWDNYDETVTDGAPALTGRHLVRAPFDNNGVVTVPLTGGVHLFTGNAVPATLGITRADASASVSGVTKLDTREVMITPLGHESTNKKGFLKNLDGSYYVSPTTGLMVVAPEQNLWDGSSLAVDIGIPMKAQGDVRTYSVTYNPSVTSDITYPNNVDNTGDSFQFRESLQNLSESGSLPFGASGYSIPQITSDYNQPFVYYNPLPYPRDGYDLEHPLLAKGDANSSDHLDLTYTFIKDGAIANYHLDVQFHLPYENWLPTGNPFGDENTDPPYSDVESSPSSTIGGQPLNVERKPVDNTVAFAYQGSSAVFTTLGAFAGEIPPLAAFLAVTGYAIDKAAPDSLSPTEYDTSSNFSDSLAITNAATGSGGNIQDILFDKPAWLTTWDTTDTRLRILEQAQCNWKLVQAAPTRTYHWAGDQYGAFGYVTTVNTDITQIERLAYYHFYYTPSLVSGQNPITP